jgi:hypothetical protein
LKIPSSVFLTILITISAAYGQIVQAQTTEPEAPKQKGFASVEVQGLDKWRSFFVFSTTEYGYIIRADGQGQITARSQSNDGSDRPRNFQLQLGLRGHLERLYFVEHEADVLMIYEVGDSRSGWGYIVRLNQKTLKSRWIKPVSGLNLGPALVEGEYAYLTAANLLFKIDLRSGASVWQQDALEKQYALSSTGFRLPSVSDERVFFQEEAENGKTLEVDKTTGKILSVKN